MSDVKVATADEALAKMAGVIEALPESRRSNAMFKANALIVAAANIKSLPDGAREDVAAEWLASEEDADLRKAAAEAVGLLKNDADVADADAGEEGADADGEPTEAEIDEWLEGLSDDEVAELLAEIEAEEIEAEDLPEEFYDAIADLSDEELELVDRYMAEAEKLDGAAGEAMHKADAMADAWLERGDEDLKKFIGAVRGAMQSAGAFSRAVGARAGSLASRASAAGARAGADVGRRVGGAIGALGGRQPRGFFRGAKRGGRIGAEVGRRAPAAAIGTGILGGGGALYASRRK
ncbi:hypothetical protein [Falsiroseomonas sp. CW058]|uniref:hypothetical protein n=1 Tax=Falsiroseomonas sp. CW058 TaxID=3388664 RepID=UPI003D322744